MWAGFEGGGGCRGCGGGCEWWDVGGGGDFRAGCGGYFVRVRLCGGVQYCAGGLLGGCAWAFYSACFAAARYDSGCAVGQCAQQYGECAAGFACQCAGFDAGSAAGCFDEQAAGYHCAASAAG